MPQMAPMNWLILFTMFITIFLIILNMNYFNFIKMKKLKFNNKTMIKHYNKFI